MKLSICMKTIIIFTWHIVVYVQPYHLFEPFLDMSLPITFPEEEKTTESVGEKSEETAETPGNAYTYDWNSDIMHPFSDFLPYWVLLPLSLSTVFA